jgi:ribosomal protein S18 acetylase RimI-like enzyme
MHIRPAKPLDQEKLPNLIARFRFELAALHRAKSSLDLEAAQAEAAEYQQEGFPIFVAEDEAGDLAGYLVCRVVGDVAWAESLYVLPEYRRQGVASRLYAEAEKLAQDLGGDTLYNWVHPNNDPIIQFLQRRGYDVLNLIELRRPRSGEKPKRVIQVGDHSFKYD